jgi:hypothetical protein
MINPWSKSFVAWQVNRVIYVSIPFTWLVNDAITFIKKQKHPVVVGGPGALLMAEKFNGLATVERTIDWCEPVTFHNPMATFTTRGCVNACDFCAVPKIEGEFREIVDFTPRPYVCDNNFLASSKKHFDRVIDKLKPLPYVEFNQGLEAKRFTPERASRIAELKIPDIRFAFDSTDKEGYLQSAIKLARKNGIKRISVLMLYGFTDTPADALYRAESLRKMKVNEIYPMRYQPLSSTSKGGFVNVAKGWTEYELQRFKSYWIKSYNGVMDNVPYAEFELDRVLRHRRQSCLFMDPVQDRIDNGTYANIV